MTSTALDTLIASEEALIGALDGDDVARIEGALGRLATALAGVQHAGGWRDTPDITTRLARALQLAEAARARIHYLADRTRRQLDQLAVLGTRTPHRLAYGRDGRA
jgi:hypothetical protein